MSAGVADVASLGLSVDSGPVKSATTALTQFSDASQRAEGGAKRVESAADALATTITRTTATTDALNAKITVTEAAGLRVGTVFEKIGKAANEGRTSLDRFNDTFRENEKAADKAAEAAKRAEAALKGLSVQGRDTLTAPERSKQDNEEFARRMASSSAIPTNATESVRKHGDAVDDAGKKAGFASHQLQNLSFQVNDAATMALSGAGAFQILATQGGQVVQLVQGAQGGIKGVLTQAGDAALSLGSKLGVAGAALAGIAGGVALVATATASYNARQRELERTTFGVGRASGATLDELNAAAEAAAGTRTINKGGAQDIIAQLNSTGKIDPKIYADVAANMRDLAKLMGTDVPAATDAVTAALAGGTAGFDRLNEKLGLGGAELRKLIEDAYDSGDAFKAQGLILDAYAAKVAATTGKTSTWRGVGQTVDPGRWIPNAVDMLGSIFGNSQTQQQQLDAARVRARRLEYQRDTGEGMFNPSDLEKAQEEIRKIEAGMANAAKSGKEARIELRSLTVQPLVDSLNPAQQRIEAITKQADLIQRYLDEGGDKLDKDGVARRTMEGLRAQAALLTDELSKGGASLANGLQQAQFNLRTLGFSDYAKSRASLEETAKNEREQLANAPDSANRTAQLKAIDDRLATQLKLLDAQTIMAGQSAATNGGGKFSRTVADAPPEWRDIILRSGAASGQDPDFITSLLWRESRFRQGLVSPKGARGVAQFMPQTAAEEGVNVDDVESSIMGMGRYLAKIGRILKTNDPVDIAMGYNRGPGAQQDWIKGGRVGSVPAETRGYVAEVFGGRVGTLQLSKEMEERRRALETEAEKVRLTTEANGKDSDGLQVRLEVLERVRNEQARGVEVTKEMVAAYTAEASQRQKLAVETRMTQFSVQGQFERDQVGRTRIEQSAFSRAQGTLGNTDSEEAKRVIRETQSNIELVEAKSATSEALLGLANDLRRGASAADAFTNVLNRIGDRALNSLVDTLTSSLFSAGKGGGGGFLGDVLGFATGASSFIGFANGGVMTPYGKLPLKSYRNGGVATRPQVAIYGEGDANEAYVPLPDGKSIPVVQHTVGGGGRQQAAGPVTFSPTYALSPAEGVSPAELVAVLERHDQMLERQLPVMMAKAQQRY